MGIWMSTIFSGFFTTKPIRILMLGLDSAGKTSVLFRLKLGTAVMAPPTASFNVETVECGNIQFQVMDFSGQRKIRPLWKTHHQNPQGLIYVVDSSDTERIEEARRELHTVLEADAMNNVPLLVFANKQDIPYGVLSPAELTDKLGLHLLQQRKWHVQPSSVVSGAGLNEGLDWLEKNLQGES